jgi:hypothetical protein
LGKDYNFGNLRRDDDPGTQAKSQAEILLKGFDYRSVRGGTPKQSTRLLKYAVLREQKDFITYKIIHTPNIDVNAASFLPFGGLEYKGIDEEDSEGGTCGSPIKDNKPIGRLADLALYFFTFLV